MGSQSDLETIAQCVTTLRDLEIPFEARVLSAHRTPAALEEYVADAESRGVKVFVAAAGGAAHLAGVVASKTLQARTGVPDGDAARRARLAALDRADAGGNPRRDTRDRPCGRGQCGAAGRRDPRARRRAVESGSGKFREAQTEKILSAPDPSV